MACNHHSYVFGNTSTNKVTDSSTAEVMGNAFDFSVRTGFMPCLMVVGNRLAGVVEYEANV